MDQHVTPHVDTAAVRAAVAGVPDPEMPPVTLGMLGMIHDLHVDDTQVTVTLLPTFAGCPAIDMIAQDVQTAVQAVDGVEHVNVAFVFSPPWTPARITPEGHAALALSGIAPPTGSVAVDPHVTQPNATTRSLPILGTGPGTRTTADVACPYCQSTATQRDTLFGPTPCRDIWFCTICTQPFERFKD